MIENVEIDGRPALVAYMTDAFVPCAREIADLAKIIFEDDETQLFVKPQAGFRDRDVDEPPEEVEGYDPSGGWSSEGEQEDLVEWVTAQDDKVCQACEDAADESPYSIDEAQALIPLHPNCRCSVTPWFTNE
jgi:hypothetical protein